MRKLRQCCFRPYLQNFISPGARVRDQTSIKICPLKPLVFRLMRLYFSPPHPSSPWEEFSTWTNTQAENWAQNWTDAPQFPFSWKRNSLNRNSFLLMYCYAFHCSWEKNIFVWKWTESEIYSDLFLPAQILLAHVTGRLNFGRSN